MYKTVDANLNARPARAVLQRIDPVAIDLRLLYTHDSNVAYIGDIFASPRMRQA